MIDTISYRREAFRRPSGSCLALGLVAFFVFAALWCIADTGHHAFGQSQGGPFCTLVLSLAVGTI